MYNLFYFKVLSVSDEGVFLKEYFQIVYVYGIEPRIGSCA